MCHNNFVQGRLEGLQKIYYATAKNGINFWVSTNPNSYMIPIVYYELFAFAFFLGKAKLLIQLLQLLILHGRKF